MATPWEPSHYVSLEPGTLWLVTNDPTTRLIHLAVPLVSASLAPSDQAHANLFSLLPVHH